MEIYIASDHAGFKLKAELVEWLKLAQYPVTDLGTDSVERVDYPDYVSKMARLPIFADQQDPPKAIGILICGTGIGMAVAANRYAHLRAALCHNAEMAALAREHNNANILVMGARYTDLATARQMVQAFLAGKFEGGRHQERIEKIAKITGGKDEQH